jgi:hypothetical protein
MRAWLKILSERHPQVTWVPVEAPQKNRVPHRTTSVRNRQAQTRTPRPR